MHAALFCSLVGSRAGFSCHSSSHSCPRQLPLLVLWLLIQFVEFQLAFQLDMFGRKFSVCVYMVVCEVLGYENFEKRDWMVEELLVLYQIPCVVISVVVWMLLALVEARVCSLHGLEVVCVGLLAAAVVGYLVHRDWRVCRKDCCLMVQCQVAQVSPDVECLGNVVQHHVVDLGLVT